MTDAWLEEIPFQAQYSVHRLIYEFYEFLVDAAHDDSTKSLTHSDTPSFTTFPPKLTPLAVQDGRGVGEFATGCLEDTANST